MQNVDEPQSGQPELAQDEIKSDLTSEETKVEKTGEMNAHYIRIAVAVQVRRVKIPDARRIIEES